MMEVQIKPVENTGQTTLNLNENVYNCKYNEPLIHQVVTAYFAGGRKGTHKQKSRSEVAGGGKKPWRQKGTGRARAGTIRSPIWRGGGIHFPARPRDYSQKINKKMYKAAIRSILSELCRQNRLIFVDDISVEQPKTKMLQQKLNDLKVDNCLIIKDNIDESLFLSARNIQYVDVTDVYGIDPVRLINYEYVVITEQAAQNVEGVFQ